MKAILKSIPILIISVSISYADEYTGREKSETCLGCHAIEGYNNTYPTYKVPKLGGQHADYIISALKAYASGLTDQDIIDIAKYFESIK